MENNKKSKVVAIIFAGGVGQRFGADIPKQFVDMNGKPVIIQTLERFQSHPLVDEIYIGCREQNIYHCARLVYEYGITKVPNKGIVVGGNSGQDTIYNILKQAQMNNSDDTIVLIHDGVRPIIFQREITESIESVIKYGTAYAVKPCIETPVVVKDGRVEDILDRNNINNGVAPQSFRLGDIVGAHEIIRKNDPDYSGVYNNGMRIVDSFGLYRAAYGPNVQINLVESNPYNIKITNSEDLKTAIGFLSLLDDENNEKKKFDIEPTKDQIEEDALSLVDTKTLKIRKDY